MSFEQLLIKFFFYLVVFFCLYSKAQPCNLTTSVDISTQKIKLFWLLTTRQHIKMHPRGKSGERYCPPPPPASLPPFHCSPFLNVEEQAISALKATITAENWSNSSHSWWHKLRPTTGYSTHRTSLENSNSLTSFWKKYDDDTIIRWLQQFEF